MIRHLRQAWKAVVAFFAPGVALLAERLLTEGGVDTETLRRALIAGVLTSVLVYAKRNGVSPDPTTSTPQT